MVEVNTAGLDRIERHIHPPMPKTVTVPFVKDGLKFIAYVTVPGFDLVIPSDEELKQAAEAVAAGLSA